MHIYLRVSSPGRSDGGGGGGGAKKEGFAPPPQSFLADYIYISMSRILFTEAPNVNFRKKYLFGRRFEI